jgi:transposase
VTVRSAEAVAACPSCGVISRRVHSRYNRQVADLPCTGRGVALSVITRRFFCGVENCQQRIFAERFDEAILATRARRTARLDCVVHHLGLALGGRPAAVFARRLMLPVSNDTLLRVVRRRACPVTAPLTVIGIDDWAFRRKSMRVIRTALGATTINTELLTCAEKLQYEGYLRREETNAAILKFAKQGVPIKQIARQLECSRKLVRQVVRGGTADVFRTRESTLDVHLPFLIAQWDAGCRNGAELWRRLKATGFRGSLRVVSEWTTRRRRAEKAGDQQLRKVPSARTIARMMTIARDQLSKADSVTVAAIEAGAPALAEAQRLVEWFHAMIRGKIVEDLDPWIAQAKASLLTSFATGITKDKAAVSAAIIRPWSNGQTEGQITKLKLVKRQMYGRGKIDLLQARLVAAA